MSHTSSRIRLIRVLLTCVVLATGLASPAHAGIFWTTDGDGVASQGETLVGINGTNKAAWLIQIGSSDITNVDGGQFWVRKNKNNNIGDVVFSVWQGTDRTGTQIGTNSQLKSSFDVAKFSNRQFIFSVPVTLFANQWYYAELTAPGTTGSDGYSLDGTGSFFGGSSSQLAKSYFGEIDLSGTLSGNSSNDQLGGSPPAVPEPSSLIVLAGLAAVGAARRKWKHSRAKS